MKNLLLLLVMVMILLAFTANKVSSSLSLSIEDNNDNNIINDDDDVVVVTRTQHHLLPQTKMIAYDTIFQPLHNNYIPSDELGFFNLTLQYYRQINPRIWLAWTPGDSVSTLALAIDTVGWMGFGVSETGAMIAAEICAFWQSGGEMAAFTMWSHNYTTPIYTSNQHCQLLEYAQVNNESMVVFTRNTISCKPQGVDLYNEWDNRFIFAFGDTPYFSYHGVNVGTSEFNFHAGPPPTYELPDDVIRLGAYMSPVEIPTVKDFTMCKAGRFPDDKRYHVVLIEPFFPNVIEPLQHHHLNYFHCKHSPTGWPPHWQDGEQKECTNPLGLECAVYFFSWLMGQGANYYMEFGLPIGQDAAVYFVMQSHYHNPLLTPGVVDDGWGLTYYYTPTLLSQECGNVGMLQWIPTMGIPAGVANTTLHTDCGDSCTQAMIPPSGTYVMAVAPHMHLVGTEVGVQHFRFNTTLNTWVELPMIHHLKHWDALMQGYRHRRQGIALLPGDYLRMFCRYDSTNWTQPIYGGEGYEDEMCMMPLMMAPRLDATGCFSMDLGNTPYGNSFCVLDSPAMLGRINPDFEFIPREEEVQNCPA